ncbi:MAG: o-succinylbenzoate--CoA ligase, partial [Phycicoccus sp.]
MTDGSRMTVELLPVPAGPAALASLPRLADALAGGRPVAPHAASADPPPHLPHDGDLPADLAIVVGTSG